MFGEDVDDGVDGIGFIECWLGIVKDFDFFDFGWGYVVDVEVVVVDVDVYVVDVDEVVVGFVVVGEERVERFFMFCYFDL